MVNNNISIKSSNYPQDSLSKSIILHLTPGILTTIAFIIFIPIINSIGFPSRFAFLIAGICVLIPIELGFLLYLGMKKNKKISLIGIVFYRKSMPLKQYIIILPLFLFYALFITMVVAPPIDNFIFNTFFSWLPDWFILSISLEYSKTILLTINILSFVVNGFMGPIIEELFFRGYLLPRISRLKIWGVFINVALHSLYHLWMPWRIPTLILMGFPLAIVIWWKKNLYLGMITHVIGNVLGPILMFIQILSIP